MLRLTQDGSKEAKLALWGRRVEFLIWISRACQTLRTRHSRDSYKSCTSRLSITLKDAIQKETKASYLGGDNKVRKRSGAPSITFYPAFIFASATRTQIHQCEGGVQICHCSRDMTLKGWPRQTSYSILHIGSDSIRRDFLHLLSTHLYAIRSGSLYSYLDVLCKKYKPHEY